jgi:predicted transcriptional regulator
MADEQPTSGNRELTTQIVAAYIRKNPVAADTLPTLISSVYEALGRLDTPSGEPVVERTPAVPIRRSVTRDFVVCMECGWKGSMVRRHLATRHGLTAVEYRARWNLPADHPMTAPAYSERRSTMAKEIGLGRMRGRSAETAAVPEMDQPTQPAPQRRQRRRLATRDPREAGCWRHGRRLAPRSASLVSTPALCIVAPFLRFGIPIEHLGKLQADTG